jgi:hypothetical protein
VWRLWFGLVTFPILLGELAFTRDVPFTPWVLANTLAFPVIMTVSIALHELGHSLVGRALALDVPRIELGIGRRIARRRFGRTMVVLNAFPILGVTYFGTNTLDRLRRRLAPVLAAGPLVTMSLVALVCVRGYRLQDLLWPDRAFVSGPAFWELLGFQNLWMAVFNMWPREVLGFHTDGAQLARLHRVEDEKLRLLLGRPLTIRASDCLDDGDLAGAEQAVAHARTTYGDSFLLREFDAHLMLERRELMAARERFVSLLGEEMPHPNVRFLLLNNIAWTNFRLRDDTLRDEADEYSSTVIKKFPRLAFALGTRGSILYWQGKYDDAITKLAEAFARGSSTRNRAINACLLSLCYAQLGRREAATRWLARARSIDPRCALLDEATRSAA